VNSDKREPGACVQINWTYFQQSEPPSQSGTSVCFRFDSLSNCWKRKQYDEISGQRWSRAIAAHVRKGKSGISKTFWFPPENFQWSLWLAIPNSLSGEENLSSLLRCSAIVPLREGDQGFIATAGDELWRAQPGRPMGAAGRSGTGSTIFTKPVTIPMDQLWTISFRYSSKLIPIICSVVFICENKQYDIWRQILNIDFYLILLVVSFMRDLRINGKLMYCWLLLVCSTWDLPPPSSRISPGPYTSVYPLEVVDWACVISELAPTWTNKRPQLQTNR
jgi:hypothetical protein